MIDTLIVPGLGGSGSNHWQREWAARDASADVVEQDDWDRPVLAEWLHRLEARIESAPSVVLVAHSLGCALVAALAGRPSAAHVAGALLVAPADTGRLMRENPSVSGFAGWAERPLPFRSILVGSRNDPFMGFRAAEDHAARWGSALVDLGRAGHVNVASGFGFWPDGMTLADGLRRRSTGSRPADGRHAARRWWHASAPASTSLHDIGLGTN